MRRNTIKHSFHLVVDCRIGVDELLKVVQGGGVTHVQLRDKHASDRALTQVARHLCSLLKVPLIMNDRVDVALVVGADGVHLGQSDLKVSDARTVLGKQALIGLSVETLEQAQAAALEDVDYLAASPVFPSKTKLDCGIPWGLEGLKQLCLASSHPIVAIGGIDETNVADVLEFGATGIAIASAVLNAPCPQMAASQIKNRMVVS